MVARKSSRVNPKYKARYRVRNWPDYERSVPDKNAEGAWSQRTSHLERIEEIGGEPG